MTARGIAARLVAKRGVAGALGCARARHAWHAYRLRLGSAPFSRTAAGLTLCAAVVAALDK